MKPSRNFFTILASLVFIALFQSTAGAQAERVEYWAPAAGGNGHWYGVYSEPSRIVDFPYARQMALAKGGDLASLSTQAEHDFVTPMVEDPRFWFELYEKHFGPWLGLIQLPGAVNPEDNWQWLDGEPVTFTAWDDGEPNDNGGGEKGFEDNCHFFSGSDGFGPEATWNDLRAPGLLTSYLVEYSQVSLNADHSIPSGVVGILEGSWAAPDSYIWVLVAGQWTPGAGVSIPGCPGLISDVHDVRTYHFESTDSLGRFRLYRRFPAWAAGQKVYLQAVDPKGCRLSNVHSVEVL